MLHASMLAGHLDMTLSKRRIQKALISLRVCAGCFVPLLLANPKPIFGSSPISSSFFCSKTNCTILFLLQIMANSAVLKNTILCVYLMVTCKLVISTDLKFAESLDLIGMVCPNAQCRTGLISVPGYVENSPDGMSFPLSAAICCGHCSCDDDCFIHGSCCLTKYDDFQQGRHYVDNARYCAVCSIFKYSVRFLTIAKLGISCADPENTVNEKGGGGGGGV